MQIFQNLNNQGKTVVLVTHEQDIAEHAKRIIRFKDGKVLLDEMVAHRRVASEELEKLNQLADD